MNPVTDGCELVPQYVSKVALSGAGGIKYEADTATMMVSSKTLGDDGTGRTSKAKVGFRYCNCIDPLSGKELAKQNCLRITNCPVEPTDYASQLFWKDVTVGVKPATVDLSTLPTMLPRGAELLARTFSYAESKFVGLHPDHFDEFFADDFRVGKLETLAWFHSVDAARFGFKPKDGKLRTVGVFWSRVDPSSSLLGARDADAFGDLRQHYEYVVTPATSKLNETLGSLPDAGKGCAFCGFILRIDLRGIIRDPVWEPPPGDPDPTPLGYVTSISRLVARPAGVIAAQRLDGGDLDVTSAIDPRLRQVLAAGVANWITPVETRLPLIGAPLVAVPLNWDAQSGIVPVAIVDGVLRLGNLRDQNVPTVTEATTDALVAVGALKAPPRPIRASNARPRPRSGAQFVYSMTEQAVFVVGGTGTAAPAGEVARYDLATGEWQRVLTPRPPLPPGLAQAWSVDEQPLGAVLAATYDVASRRLIVVDEVTVAGKTYRRFVEVDVDRRAQRIAYSAPVTGAYSRITLTPLADGTFAMFGQKPGKAWDSVRFSLPQLGAVDWRGWSRGTGEIMENPFLAGDGVVVPLRQAGAPRAVTLTTADFSGGGPCVGF